MDGIGNLRNKTITGFMWKMLERLLAQGVSLAVSIILARLLMPDDYSVVGIANIFFAFCNLFISNGLNVSLIQKKDTDDLDYSTVMCASIVIGMLCYLIMWIIAPYVASIYNKPILVPLFRVMSFTLIINAYKGVITAKISHNLEFKKFFFATLGGTIVSALIGIMMAYMGFGAWALVAQSMTNHIIDSIILTYSVRYRFLFVFSFSRLKQHLTYSWKLFVASIITTLYDQVKPLIVGIRFSTVDLAFYNKGSGFPGMINSTISNSLSGVLFPALSKLQNDKQSMLAATRRYIKTASFFVFPMMLGLFAVSENFVQFLLTDKWKDSVPFMRIFCICYMFDLVNIGNLQAIRASGRTDIILITEVLKKTVYALIIIVFVYTSNTAFNFALADIACTAFALTVNTFPNKKIIGYSYKLQAEDLLPNLIISVLMCGIVILIGKINVSIGLKLVLQIASGLFAYLLLCIVSRNPSFRYIINLLRVKKTMEKVG